MDACRAWVLLLCGVSFATAAAGALIPGGSTKGAFRVLTAVVVLYALLLPLQNRTGAQVDFEALLPDRQAQEESFAARAEDAQLLSLQQALETEIARSLQKHGFSGCVVRVECAAFSDGLAPTTITVRGKLGKAALEPVLQPYLTSHTRWELFTED